MELLNSVVRLLMILIIVLTTACSSVREKAKLETHDQRVTDFWFGPEGMKVMEVISSASYVVNEALVLGNFSKINDYFAPPSALLGLGNYSFPITTRNLTDTTDILVCKPQFTENIEQNALFFMDYKIVTSTKLFTEYENLKQIYNENSVGIVVTQEYDTVIHFRCRSDRRGHDYQVESIEGTTNVCYFLSKSKDGLWKISNIRPFNSSDFCNIYKGNQR